MNKDGLKMYQLYKVFVDGFLITQITLPAFLSQDERNEYRNELAKEYGVPAHYFRLRPDGEIKRGKMGEYLVPIRNQPKNKAVKGNAEKHEKLCKAK